MNRHTTKYGAVSWLIWNDKRESHDRTSGHFSFFGGSYVQVPHYRHRLRRWEKLAIQAQEDIYGRTKAENIEYQSADKAPTATPSAPI